jgi:hypothetical protein
VDEVFRAPRLMPNFTAAAAEGPVRSFCKAMWGGVRDGSLKPDSANRPNGLTSVSSINERALQLAFAILLARHPVLNCRIEDRAGAPWLIPLDRPARPQVELLDHRNTHDETNRGAVEEAIGALVWRPIDVETGPLYRAYAVVHGRTGGYVGLVVHHFIADAVAIHILMRELRYIYEVIIRGEQPRLKPPGLSYPSYLQAMNDWVEQGSGAAALSQVIDRLKVFPRFDLAVRVSPTGVSEEFFVLEAEVASKIRSTARMLGTSPFTVLLAAQNILLLPYCTTATVPMKVITAARELSQLVDIVGNVADRMVVLSDLEHCSNFSDVVRQTQKALAWCRRHAFVRHDFIQAAPEAAGISMAAPVFNFRAIGRQGPGAGAASALMANRPLRVPPPQTKRTRPNDAYYLVVTDTGEEMRCDIRYGQGHITGFAEQFGKTLSDLCSDPAAKFGTR